MRLTIDEYKTALREVVGPADEVVVLYSALWGFGHRFGMRPEALTGALIEATLETLNPSCTLLMPTFFADFPRTRRFDLVLGKPYTGALPDRFRAWPNVQRTRQPMDSYAVYGPRAAEVLARPCSTAWGDDSVLGWFDAVDARHVILGVPWHLSCAYCHRGEEVAGVPFRYHKRFAGTLLENGLERGLCEETMYVRPFDVDPGLCYKPIRDRLGELGMVIESGHPDFHLQSSLSSDILRVSIELLNRDPLVFVGNKAEVTEWIANGRDAELERLAQDQRPRFEQWPIGSTVIFKEQQL